MACSVLCCPTKTWRPGASAVKSQLTWRVVELVPGEAELFQVEPCGRSGHVLPEQGR